MPSLMYNISKKNRSIRPGFSSIQNFISAEQLQTAVNNGRAGVACLVVVEGVQAAGTSKFREFVDD